MSPSILVPVQYGYLSEGHSETVLNLYLPLVVIEEEMTVYLWLAEDDLEEFQISFVL